MQQLQMISEKRFKSAAKKAILSILLFLVSYLVLLVLSIGLVLLCGWLGVFILELSIGFVTLGLALGIFALGIIIFIFLIKFVFKKHVVDRSHLIELQERDAPLLYQDIRTLVDQIQTNFPKKIYVSHEVNASVFYDSTFLSMFFPVKKNLQIGLALVNSTTKEELKSILAHEFGHFSQKSMKVGSYVYSVNQIIYNLVAENENYNRNVQGFGNISSYFAIFTFLGLKIITGIQWILKKLYGVVNINHLGLSRQMEFHADAVAVNAVGTEVFKNALLRLDLANNAYDQVLNYYDQKIPENIKPLNVYPQQFFAMNFFASAANIDIVNNFPKVSVENLSRYNLSKLVIKDQWASHPSTEDRIAAIDSYNFEKGNDDGTPATSYFVELEELQHRVTSVLFGHVEFKGKPTSDSFEEFKEGFLSSRKGVEFPKIFNDYYSKHNPVKVDLENATATGANLKFDDLFSSAKVDLVYNVLAIQNDIATLKQLQLGNQDIKTFEYDGSKYTVDEIADLLKKIEIVLQQEEEKVSLNDIEIYHYFKRKAGVQQTLDNLNQYYQSFIDFDEQFVTWFEVYARAVDETQFIQVTTPFDQIEINLNAFKSTETELKALIRQLLVQQNLSITAEARTALDKYAENELVYFEGTVYQDENLNTLFEAINFFVATLNENYLLIKSHLLNKFEELELSDLEENQSKPNAVILGAS